MFAVSYTHLDVYKRQVVELRKKWGDVVSVLKDKRFDEIVNQYSCFSHAIDVYKRQDLRIV